MRALLGTCHYIASIAALSFARVRCRYTVFRVAYYSPTQGNLSPAGTKRR